MRGRPDIDLRLPPVVHPGEEVAIEVVATSHSDTPIDFFDVAFEGDELATLNPDSVLRSHVKTIVHDAARLRDEGVLAEGEHRFEARFTVPADAPPSYLGALTTIRYQVRVHVSIPWWPDLRETYELLVEHHPTPRPPPAPAAAVSDASNGQPFIELSLADTRFAPNDEVSGAFATGNVGRDAGDGVEISLVALERVQSGQAVFTAEQMRHNLPNLFRAPRGGREVPFRFRVPKDAVPSFESAACRLSWMLTATFRSAMFQAATVAIPVVIGRHAGGRAGARMPDVGASRWRAAWAAAGEPHGLALDEERLSLAGARGDVRVRVDVCDDEDEGALSATFSYPPLMLGLRAAPQLLVMLPTDLEQMFPGLRIEHRELEQARAFLGALRDTLATVKLASADDRTLVVRGQVAGYDRQSVEPFLSRATAIAEAIRAAIDAVPPPASMRDALPAWRAFASATGARLVVGGMALRGASVDGALFDVTTQLGADGDPTATRVEMRLDPPLPRRAQRDLGNPGSDAELPPGCRELVEALRASVRRLEVRRGALAIELAGGTLDPAGLRPKMIEMFVLARRLRGDRSPGPYR